MRYSIPIKSIAIFLTAVMLVAGFACVAGILQVASLGLYTNEFDSWVQNRLEWQAHNLAQDLTERYAVHSLTNCSDAVLEELGYWYVFRDSVHWTGLEESNYSFTITDPAGGRLAAGDGITDPEDVFSYQTGCSVQFPVLVTDEETINTVYGRNYRSRETVYLKAYDGKPVTIRYYTSPEYIVDVSLSADPVLALSGTSVELVELIYGQRYNMIIALAVSLLLFATGMIYLSTAAGRSPQSHRIQLGGFNRLPLDVYLALGGGAGVGIATLAVQLVNDWTRNMQNLNVGTVSLAATALLGIALIAVGFLYALCAQVKMKGLYWWRHTFLCWLLDKLWKVACVMGRGIAAVADMLPVTWLYVLIGSLMGMTLTGGVLLAVYQQLYWPVVCIGVLYLAIVAYGGYAYGVLLKGAQRMTKGDLNTKINTKYLVGAYAKCAHHLNALADVAVVAAQKQMRSERMKTELITNISHDIKTPLTSIINYVDILRSAKSAEEAVQYLEVLGRQSQRLKKLIDDLVEMSKASSGSMPVEINRIDPTEAVNQALGEFSDKLAGQDLQVIFNQPQEQLSMLADGRLTWRVLSNLLSNIVKYAMPGTRVYADVITVEDRVLISLKNISREALNVSADELTERFVRGDTSRNTEGSGLGLNIAKSLMELQKGSLQLLVDGDLFKITLDFPAADTL